MFDPENVSLDGTFSQKLHNTETFSIFVSNEKDNNLWRLFRGVYGVFDF